MLIVDDSHDARELYAMYFDHVGYSVRAVADGQAAIDAAVEMQPDVIVMDLSMPQVDGITATERLRQHPRTRDVPVILLTGFRRKPSSEARWRRASTCSSRSPSARGSGVARASADRVEAPHDLALAAAT